MANSQQQGQRDALLLDQQLGQRDRLLEEQQKRLGGRPLNQQPRLGGRQLEQQLQPEGQQLEQQQQHSVWSQEHKPDDLLLQASSKRIRCMQIMSQR